jgi:hypothetical protein
MPPQGRPFEGNLERRRSAGRSAGSERPEKEIDFVNDEHGAQCLRRRHIRRSVRDFRSQEAKVTDLADLADAPRAAVVLAALAHTRGRQPHHGEYRKH